MVLILVTQISYWAILFDVVIIIILYLKLKMDLLKINNLIKIKTNIYLL